MKDFIKISIAVVTFIFGILTTIIVTKIIVMDNIGLVIKEEGIFNTKLKPRKIENFENKYSDFLDDEKAEYIVNLCEDFKLDTDLVIAILQKENPTLKTDAVSKMNENGSVDLGLFQLNSMSLYEWGFLENWWKEKTMGEFDPANWKHNAYIAIKYIEDLTETFGENNAYHIAAAYNAGSQKAWNNYTNNKNGIQLPQSTVENYVPSVLLNYRIWKSK